MSVLKFIHAQDPFARIPNETARDPNLRSEGLAVITYLASRPEDWIPREYDVRRRFKFGRDKMRTVWSGLEAAGYVERNHRQKLGGGRIGTITTVSVLPVFSAGGGSTGGGSSATGQADAGAAEGGSPTTLQIKNEKEKATKKEPVREADGNPQNAPASPERLSFESEFGFGWSSSWDRFLSEHRAMAIMKKSKVTGTDIARRIMAEWAASVSRNSGKGQLCDPAALLVSLCRRGADGQLGHTKDGDERMPKWA